MLQSPRQAPAFPIFEPHPQFPTVMQRRRQPYNCTIGRIRFDVNAQNSSWRGDIARDAVAATDSAVRQDLAHRLADGRPASARAWPTNATSVSRAFAGEHTRTG